MRSPEEIGSVNHSNVRYRAANTSGDKASATNQPDFFRKAFAIFIGVLPNARVRGFFRAITRRRRSSDSFPAALLLFAARILGRLASAISVSRLSSVS
ncbi:MAG: hypothetical protein DME42_09690, partial [Verrucomicrobia bacterium]